jgi:hypothetical protein
MKQFQIALLQAFALLSAQSHCCCPDLHLDREDVLVLPQLVKGKVCDVFFGTKFPQHYYSKIL